jgi:hypothetical protein
MTSDGSAARQPRKPPAREVEPPTLWKPRPGGPPSANRITDLVEAARQIAETDVWDAGLVRYAGRCFIQQNLPHSIRNIDQYATFVRENGKMSLQVKPDARFGIPYGSIPRLILLWIASEVRLKEEPRLYLGDNLSKFMRQLDLVPTGGRWGSVTSLRNQMERLFNADIRFRYNDEDNSKGKLFAIQEYDLWWSTTEQSDLWQSTILLTNPLFEELLKHSAPVDMRVIKILRRSPMELDIYCWLTYRMLTLNRPLFLPYKDLAMQFGSSYDNPRHFKANIDKALWSVLKQYPQARVQPDSEERGKQGWRLLPSPPHVAEKAPRPRKRLTSSNTST